MVRLKFGMFMTVLAATALALIGCATANPTDPTSSPQPPASSSSPSPSTTPSPSASPSTTPSPSIPPSTTPSPSTSPVEPLIEILGPQAGVTLMVPLQTRGTANTFEASLMVDAVNQAGDILCVRQVTATSGSGTPGTWEAILGFAPESETTDLPATIRAYELSPKDGSVINLVERPIMVSAERPPIVLTSPVCGDTVAPGGALTIQGLAAVFEAALTVEVRDASGTAVFTRNMMTADGNVESPFGEIVTLPANLPSGFYDVVAFNYSAKDGSIENEFPVQIRVG